MSIASSQALFTIIFSNFLCCVQVLAVCLIILLACSDNVPCRTDFLVLFEKDKIVAFSNMKLSYNTINVGVNKISLIHHE